MVPLYRVVLGNTVVVVIEVTVAVVTASTALVMNLSACAVSKSDRNSTDTVDFTAIIATLVLFSSLRSIEVSVAVTVGVGAY
jgi:hypothetical protein